MHVEAAKAQARVLNAVEALTPHLHKTNPKLLAQVADSLYFLLIGECFIENSIDHVLKFRRCTDERVIPFSIRPSNSRFYSP